MGPPCPRLLLVPIGRDRRGQVMVLMASPFRSSIENHRVSLTGVGSHSRVQFRDLRLARAVRRASDFGEVDVNLECPKLRLFLGRRNLQLHSRSRPRERPVRGVLRRATPDRLEYERELHSGVSGRMHQFASPALRSKGLRAVPEQPGRESQ